MRRTISFFNTLARVAESDGEPELAASLRNRGQEVAQQGPEQCRGWAAGAVGILKENGFQFGKEQS